MPIGKMQIYDISFTVFLFVRLFFVCLFVCVFVRLQIFPARIKLTATNFAWWFRGVLGREFPIFWEFYFP